jgi:hypothetical protein
MCVCVCVCVCVYIYTYIYIYIYRSLGIMPHCSLTTLRTLLGKVVLGRMQRDSAGSWSLRPIDVIAAYIYIRTHTHTHTHTHTNTYGFN